MCAGKPEAVWTPQVTVVCYLCSPNRESLVAARIRNEDARTVSHWIFLLYKTHYEIERRLM